MNKKKITYNENTNTLTFLSFSRSLKHSVMSDTCVDFSLSTDLASIAWAKYLLTLLEGVWGRDESLFLKGRLNLSDRLDCKIKLKDYFLFACKYL